MGGGSNKNINKNSLRILKFVTKLPTPTGEKIKNTEHTEYIGSEKVFISVLRQQHGPKWRMNKSLIAVWCFVYICM